MSGPFKIAFDLEGHLLEEFAANKMKSAVSGISKKDYYDLYELLNVYTFAELFDVYSKMYPNWDAAGTLRSLSNFRELELEDPEGPVSLNDVSWDMVKIRLSTEIKNHVRMLQ